MFLRLLGAGRGGPGERGPRVSLRPAPCRPEPRSSRTAGTCHFHVFPREVLDLLLHPLDALQQVLVLLVHPLVLLHQRLQLYLGLTGAFQLRRGQTQRSGSLKARGWPSSCHRGEQRSTALGAATTRTCSANTWRASQGSISPRPRSPGLRQEEEATPDRVAHRWGSGCLLADGCVISSLPRSLPWT